MEPTEHDPLRQASEFLHGNGIHPMLSPGHVQLTLPLNGMEPINTDPLTTELVVDVFIHVDDFLVTARWNNDDDVPPLVDDCEPI